MANETKPILHISQVETLERCGEQYRRRYGEKEIIAPGIALVVGISTHKVIETDLENLLAAGALLPDEAIADLAYQETLRLFEGEVFIDEDDKGKSLAAVRGETADVVIALTDLHHKRVAPTIRPVALEEEWKLETQLPYDMAGRIDIREATRIRDTKTTAKSPPKNAADKSDQLTMYAMANKVYRPDDPAPSLLLDFLVKTKTPKHVHLETTRGDEDFRALLDRLAVAMSAIEKGIFVPASSGHWICSPRYCGYFSTCKYTRGRVFQSLSTGD